MTDTTSLPAAAQWTDLTAVLAGSESGWAHPGLAYADGLFLTTDATLPRVVAFDLEGRPAWSFDVDAREIHGIEVDGDVLWLADPGAKECADGDGGYRTDLAARGGQVLGVDGAGSVFLRIGRPDLPIYREQEFRPTSVVAAADLWVADGYGADLVHQYRRDGVRVATIGLDDLRLDNPHSLAWDPRGEPRLLIADRGNSRILAIDPDTRALLAVIGAGDVERPSGMTIWGPYLLVADLNGHVAVFDGEDRLVTRIGAADPPLIDREGWPNVTDDGETVAPTMTAGVFNSPHDIATTPEGTLMVCEWVIGGRLTAISLPPLLPSPENTSPT